MDHATAARMIDGMSRTQAISLSIIVQERRNGGDFAAAATEMLGAKFRDLFASVAGRAMSDSEIRAYVLASVAG